MAQKMSGCGGARVMDMMEGVIPAPTWPANNRNRLSALDISVSLAGATSPSRGEPRVDRAAESALGPFGAGRPVECAQQLSFLSPFGRHRARSGVRQAMTAGDSHPPPKRAPDTSARPAHLLIRARSREDSHTISYGEPDDCPTWRSQRCCKSPNAARRCRRPARPTWRAGYRPLNVEDS